MRSVRLRSRGLRVVRGLLVAVLSVTIAAFSHVSGGGLTPGVLGTILALVFAVLVSIALSGRALSAPPLAVAVSLSQFVFHLLFSLGADIPRVAGDAHVGMLGMVMSGGQSSGLPSLAEGGAAPTTETMSDARMWGMHAVAALVTVLLLLHGERALVALARLATARLAIVIDVVRALPDTHGSGLSARSVEAPQLLGRRRLDVILAARPHRGPPALV